MTMKALATPYLGLSQLPNKPCFPVGHPVPSADHVTSGSTCPSPQQTGLPAYLSRVPSLPETIYGHGSSPMAMHHRHARPDERYSSPMTAAPPSAHMPYHYEHLMASHPYATMYPGFDMNSIKRKNATRESTSALKAWLYQHRKNPYPTKAEKVMLAIVSHMTLTQVSTWFANARRRLKKENKLEDGDIDLDDLDDQASTSQHSDYDSDVTSGAANTSIALTDISDNSDLDEQTTNLPPAKRQCTRGLISPDNRNEVFLDRLSAPVDKQAAPISGHHNHFNIIRNTNCGENMVTMRHNETSVSDEPTNLKVIADASSVNAKRDTESDPETAKRQSNEKVQLNTKGQANANQNTPRHKIWSIANIIA